MMTDFKKMIIQELVAAYREGWWEIGEGAGDEEFMKQLMINAKEHAEKAVLRIERRLEQGFACEGTTYR